jgi:hypothetical protein
LGSEHYPHLKLEVVRPQPKADWVFTVDTHDGFSFGAAHPDASGWRTLQINNRKLKEQIERAWEANGLLTFNGLLRRDLNKR